MAVSRLWVVLDSPERAVWTTALDAMLVDGDAHPSLCLANSERVPIPSHGTPSPLSFW